MSLHIGNIEQLFDDLRKIGSGVLQNGLQAFHGALRLRRHAAGNNRTVGLTPRHAGSEQDPARVHAHPGHVPPALLHRVIGKNVTTVHTLPSFLQCMYVWVCRVRLACLGRDVKGQSLVRMRQAKRSVAIPVRRRYLV